MLCLLRLQPSESNVQAVMQGMIGKKLWHAASTACAIELQPEQLLQWPSDLAADNMFEPLRDTVALLAKFGITMSEIVLKQLEDGPLQWKGLKKKVFQR